MRSADESSWVPGSEVPERAGISYRQFDYWVRCGHIRVEEREPGAGSGYPRRVYWREVAVARLMGELTRAGIDVSVAAVAAREMQERGAARLGGFELRRVGEG